MRSTLLAVAILFLVTACGGDQPASSPVVIKDAAVAAPECPSPFYSPLPDAGIRFPFAFHLHEDRFYRASDGASRQRVVLEYFSGDAASTWQAVEKALKSAGYRRASVESTEFRGTFRKTGMPVIFVDTSGPRPQAVANPKARGTIWISWGLANAQADAALAN